jgi:hypothetical protein
MDTTVVRNVLEVDTEIARALDGAVRVERLARGRLRLRVVDHDVVAAPAAVLLDAVNPDGGNAATAALVGMVAALGAGDDGGAHLTTLPEHSLLSCGCLDPLVISAERLRAVGRALVRLPD